MSGKTTKIDVDKDTQIDVQSQIHQLSFSPHTDAKGIMDLVKFLSPKHVILVHGEKPKMTKLKGRIISELGIPCYDPENNENVSISSTVFVKAEASSMFIRSCSNPNFKFLNTNSDDKSDSNLKGLSSKEGATNVSISRCSNSSFKFSNININNKFRSNLKMLSCTTQLRVSDDRANEGIMVMEKGKKAKVVHQDELLLLMGEQKHELRFSKCCPILFSKIDETQSINHEFGNGLPCPPGKHPWLFLLSSKISDELSDRNIQNLGEYLQIESFILSICSKDNCPYRSLNSTETKIAAVFCCCSWLVEDENLAWEIISILEKHDSSDELGEGLFINIAFEGPRMAGNNSMSHDDK